MHVYAKIEILLLLLGYTRRLQNISRYAVF